MNIHKREIIYDSTEEHEIDYFGFNSKGSFTICLDDGVIINLSRDEWEKLKRFVEKFK